MRKDPYELLFFRVREIVEAAGLRDEFEQAPLFHLRLEQETYHPLEISCFPTPDPLMPGEHRRLRIGHYLTRNGVTFADLELEMNNAGAPIALKEWGHISLIRWRDPTTQQVMLSAYNKQNFADHVLMWARNIKAQGWIEVAAHVVSGDQRQPPRKLLSLSIGKALAIDLEVNDPEGTAWTEDHDLREYSDLLVAIERAFPERTGTPKEQCRFLDRDIWMGHLRILLLGQTTLTQEQMHWLQTDTDVAWYECTLIDYHKALNNSCIPLKRKMHEK